MQDASNVRVGVAGHKNPLVSTLLKKPVAQFVRPLTDLGTEQDGSNIRKDRFAEKRHHILDSRQCCQCLCKPLPECSKCPMRVIT
jgi:hypothetical protein